jgi:hypothetical protein
VNTHSAEIIKGVELGRQSAVYTEELLVHHSGEREGAEGVHACIVYTF